MSSAFGYCPTLAFAHRIGPQFTASSVPTASRSVIPLLVTYGFDDAWELVPGPWRVQFFYGERLLGERTFTVVKKN